MEVETTGHGTPVKGCQFERLCCAPTVVGVVEVQAAEGGAE